MRRPYGLVIGAVSMMLFVAANAQPAAHEAQDAAPATREAQEAAQAGLPFADAIDFDDAKRGRIAPLPSAPITTADGRVVWDPAAYAFLDTEMAPPTVHPALWRQARLNAIAGLFRVADGVYQVRGADLSNMTFIEGDNGLILIDVLTTVETARAAIALYAAHRPMKPVVAVILTHSHVDHFGGIKGVIEEANVKSGRVKLIAPEGFLEHAVSENIFAGNAMARRAAYMFGVPLPRNDRGQVDGGLGKGTPPGTITLIAPNDIVKATGETRTIEGIEFVFQMAQNTEAPAEMLVYLPHVKALCAAEVMTHTFHNLYTIRGAQVRDASAWWKAIHEAITLFGDKTEVVFATHHWPVWGNDRANAFMKNQRDLYKYIHDQSLRLMNQGYTMVEVGEMLELPETLSGPWYNREYYGTVNHNAKAVYQRYLGWYDGNPATLHPLPPAESAAKYVEFMGGAAAVIAKARESYAKGEYRWVAQVLNHVVFADPANAEARALAADALEQLGYQAESAPWRNAYLVGAGELRNGPPSSPGAIPFSADTIKAMTLDMYFDFMGIRLNGPKSADKRLRLNWNFTDTGDQYLLELENSVLVYTKGQQAADADATLNLTRAVLDAVALQQTAFPKELAAGTVSITGNPAAFGQLMGLMDTFDRTFPIVTP